ncbi:MAG TPA: response regulator [Thermoanaerobaculia bacterium]|nr:response regulator [Thermoanaerobaculia bacterium]
MKLQKILIVEDSELLHRMYEVVFRQHRFKQGVLLHAMNGKEALDRLAQHSDVDLIVLDINMPVMSGLQFLQFCQSERVFREIPVIVVSTESKKDDTLRALQAGARGYVTKPFRPHDLHALIDRIFGFSDRPTARPAVAVAQES